MKTQITLACAVSLLLAGGLRAQEQSATNVSRPMVGAIGGASLNTHSAYIERLPWVPRCGPALESGTGIAPSLGAFYQHPVSQDLFVALRGTYSGYGGTLEVSEPTTIAQGGVDRNIAIEHTLSTTVTAAGIEPYVGYWVAPNIGVQIGATLGYVLTRTFEQKETLPPDGGVFTTTGRRSQNEVSGKLPEPSDFYAGATIGVHYALPLNASNTLQAAPELSYTFGITNIVKSLEWKVNTLRGGIAIRYVIPESIPEPPVDTLPTPPKELPVEEKKPALLASLSAVGVDNEDVESEVATVKVEELYALQTNPLLPYVFFDASSVELPSRYGRLRNADADRFTIDSLRALDPLTVQQHVLDVIGSRMRDLPSTRIEIVGCAAEVESSSLSQPRAKAVQEYLGNVWSIPAGRMTLSQRHLPSRPTSGPDVESHEENQRVEIHSNAALLLAPVITEDTIRTATPPIVRFRPSVQAEAGVASWKLTVSEGAEGDTRVLKEYGGAGQIPEQIDWVVAEEPDHIPRYPGVVRSQLIVTDRAGQSRVADHALPIDQVTLRKKLNKRIASKEIEQFHLILFDFESAALSPQNLQTVEFIKSRIREKSTVRILGYTDRLGDEAFNRTLSDLRASSVAKALGVDNAAIEGKGESELLFDNNLPEGRLFSRTVLVVIETPLETP